jgi:leader peptidase (prepilin peptidase) / N-methyltransferase
MTLLAALLGLIAGNLLNIRIARDVQEQPEAPQNHSWHDRIPIAGAVRRRDWVALTVELLSAAMAGVLVLHYGLSARSLFLFGASLVLIHTGAVDFRIRMIDTLVMVVATIVALALAPVNELRYVRSAQGLATAAAMFLFFYVLAKVMFRGVHAPFGLGDVYLAAFIGALVGFFDLTTALFYGIGLAGLVATTLLIMRAMGRPTPMYISYGTYLCLGALLFLALGR